LLDLILVQKKIKTLRNSGVSICVIGATDDTIIHTSHTKKLEKSLKPKEVIVLPGGHYINFEGRLQFTAAILRNFSRASPESLKDKIIEIRNKRIETDQHRDKIHIKNYIGIIDLH